MFQFRCVWAHTLQHATYGSRIPTSQGPCTGDISRELPGITQVSEQALQHLKACSKHPQPLPHQHSHRQGKGVIHGIRTNDLLHDLPQRRRRHRCALTTLCYLITVSGTQSVNKSGDGQDRPMLGGAPVPRSSRCAPHSLRCHGSCVAAGATAAPASPPPGLGQSWLLTWAHMT